jgi:hypothetical protein
MGSPRNPPRTLAPDSMMSEARPERLERASDTQSSWRLRLEPPGITSPPMSLSLVLVAVCPAFSPGRDIAMSRSMMLVQAARLRSLS